MNNSYTLGDDNVLPPIGPFGITSIAPNPTSGQFVVEYEAPADAAVQLQFTTIGGANICRSAATGNTCRLDAANLPAGQYLVYLIVDDAVKDIKPLIVE